MTDRQPDLFGPIKIEYGACGRCLTVYLNRDGFPCCRHMWRESRISREVHRWVEELSLPPSAPLPFREHRADTMCPGFVDTQSLPVCCSTGTPLHQHDGWCDCHGSRGWLYPDGARGVDFMSARYRPHHMPRDVSRCPECRSSNIVLDEQDGCLPRPACRNCNTWLRPVELAPIEEPA